MKKTLLLIFCAFALLLGGCSPGPQYIPANLADRPASKIAVLIVDLRLQYLKIDNKIAVQNETLFAPDPIFLRPGRHRITYRVYGETDQWRAYSKSLIKDGYKLSVNGRLFIKNIGGIKIAKNAYAYPRYGWNTRKKIITIEAGKRRKLSSF